MILRHKKTRRNKLTLSNGTFMFRLRGYTQSGGRKKFFKNFSWRDFSIYQLEHFYACNSNFKLCNVVIFLIFKNNDFQGHCRRSPGAPLKEGVLGYIHDISWLDYRKSKNQKDFVYIIYYLVINRRNKQILIFHKMAASQENFRFFITILALNCV